MIGKSTSQHILVAILKSNTKTPSVVQYDKIPAACGV